jgi:hypothetical protein
VGLEDGGVGRGEVVIMCLWVLDSIEEGGVGRQEYLARGEHN